MTSARDRPEVESRSVSEAEALSGIGTYVGSCLCVARVPAGAAKLWDYGVAVGYSRNEATSSGVLHLVLCDGGADIPFDERMLLDLAPETYALRPCARRAVCDIMPREMQHLHSEAYKYFNGIDRRSSRKSATISSSLHCSAVDESSRIPLFDAATSEVVTVSIKYLLNFSYYSGGRRRVPQSVQLGTSIFDDLSPSSTGATPEQSTPIETTGSRQGAASAAMVAAQPSTWTS